jgi:hypothetical protein
MFLSKVIQKNTHGSSILKWILVSWCGVGSNELVFGSR